MDVPLFIVDAFTTRAFSGNPAAVCVLDAPMPEATMQAVAAEMNLSETAFAYPKGNGGDGRYGLRWFTPTKEIPLCGHATLATAAVLRERGERAPVLRFDTLSGELRVADDAEGRGGLTMDFPFDAPRPHDAPKALLDAVGAPVVDACIGDRSGNVLLRLPDEAAVRAARPDPRALLAAADVKGVILTARGRDAGVDFVSRYFTPWYGIDEDPVTGSSHTLLGPYWARELGRTTLTARQVSRRGGEMGVRVRNDGRVDLTGQSVILLRGRLSVPNAS